ncbi:hypothetical protein ACTNDN_03615 [Niallia sp. HCP3S3_B10]|jgi:hypothetical protein|nr:hypothetical protein [Niallia sp. MER TA 168]MCM3364018.1 hypothetical protein [Niallia sp. MER TA 168]
MLLGSESYQYKDSYFVVVRPITYVVIGILVFVSVVTFITLKMRKK